MYRPVPATQPCTLVSRTGCRVYRLVLATQSCTLASTTGYRVYRLGWLHSLVHLLQPTGYKSTNRVLAAQSLLYSASPQLVTKKKKEKKKKYIYTSSCLNSWVTPTYQFCRLQRFTGYRKLSVTETWYLTELPKVILVIENC